MNQKEIEKMEVYYERIQKLVHGLEIPITNNFLTIVFKMGLQSYLRIVATQTKQSTLQHKEVAMLCENV